LDPGAWIAKLWTSRPGWEVVDLDERPVPVEEVLRRPDRLAAVYFVNDAPRDVPRDAGGRRAGPVPRVRALQRGDDRGLVGRHARDSGRARGRRGRGG